MSDLHYISVGWLGTVLGIVLFRPFCAFVVCIEASISLASAFMPYCPIEFTFKGSKRATPFIETKVYGVSVYNMRKNLFSNQYLHKVSHLGKYKA